MAVLSFFKKRKGPSPPPAPPSPPSAIKPTHCRKFHFYMYVLIRVHKLPGGGGGGGGGGSEMGGV